MTGVLAVGVLEWLGTSGVNGGGYEALGQALAGNLGLKTLAALCLAKVVATVFSYSSGGAGGIFAPSLFVGAMLGGTFGYLDVAVLGHEERQLGAFALVGMGAVFAGVIRAPITSVLIIFEMTGGYGLVLPLMLANMTAYMLARHLRPVPIYEALLAQDGIVLPHQEGPPPAVAGVQRPAEGPGLPGVPPPPTASSLARFAPLLSPGATFDELLQQLAASPSQGVVIGRAPGRIVGAILLEQVRELAMRESTGVRPLAGALAQPFLIVPGDATLAELLALDDGEAAPSLLVLGGPNDGIGLIDRNALFRAAQGVTPLRSAP